MKTWRKKYEWAAYAACADNPIHTAEPEREGDVLTPVFPYLAEARMVCESCKVRPECIEWAIADKACAVVVAGVYLPDPMFKKQLRAAYSELQKSLDGERAGRGDI